jgi:hypothetical protein
MESAPERPWLEWLTRRGALARAAQDDARREAERVLLARGGSAVRAADRLLDPPDGSASQPALAMSLYREACLWLLAAAQVGSVEQGLGPLLARADQALSALGLARPERAVSDALARDAPAFAALSEVEQGERARAAQRWLAGLLEHLELAASELLRLKLERNVRVGAVLIVAVAAAIAGVVAIGAIRRGPDLAAGKPWRTSSTLAHCQPAQRWCAETRTAIFFHTKEEDAPWLEIDLGSAQRISRVEVTNRSDFGPERAVPLLIELSTDGKNYWPAASRVAVFEQWDATFAPRQARYVRLTVQRRTVFHLERVSVRR